MFTERLAALLSAAVAVRRQDIRLSIAAASVAVDVSIVAANQTEGAALWNAVEEWTVPILSSALGTAVERLTPPTLVFIPYQAPSPWPPESLPTFNSKSSLLPETNSSLTLPSAEPFALIALVVITCFLGSIVVGIALLCCWWRRRQQAKAKFGAQALREHRQIVLTRPKVDMPSAGLGDVAVSVPTIGAFQTPESTQRCVRGLGSVYESPASDYEDSLLESRMLRARRALLGALDELRTLPDTGLARDSEEPWNVTRRAQGKPWGRDIHGISVQVERHLGPSIASIAEESSPAVDGMQQWPGPELELAEEEAAMGGKNAADAVKQATRAREPAGGNIVPHVQTYWPSQPQPQPQPPPQLYVSCSPPVPPHPPLGRLSPSPPESDIPPSSSWIPLSAVSSPSLEAYARPQPRPMRVPMPTLQVTPPLLPPPAPLPSTPAPQVITPNQQPPKLLPPKLLPPKLLPPPTNKRTMPTTTVVPAAMPSHVLDRKQHKGRMGTNPQVLSRAFKVGRRLSLRHAIISWARHGQQTFAHARNVAIIAAVRQIYADRQLFGRWLHWVRAALDWSAEHGRLLLARQLFLRRQMLRQALRMWRHRSAHFLTPIAPLASVERPAACRPRSGSSAGVMVPSLRI